MLNQIADWVAGPVIGRSVAAGRHGMAATSHPLATLTAVDTLRDGGTAADAAIAACAMLGVVEPMNCGLGGDLFVIHHDPASAQLHGLNGPSPAAA